MSGMIVIETIKRIESGEGLACSAKVADFRWLAARLPADSPRSLFFLLWAREFEGEL
jgi:hypothetical protein